ncbi:altered inheritance of mitochondria protein 21-like [Nicotiana tomentosiformis]|uniref:altered inheritance of mitochondria protein 21-like n=1 Tax=Nicotiana tomentosiformis TaxID=4098 RepID=UPI00388CBFCA
MIQNQTSEVQNDGKTGKDQAGSSKEKLLDKQKQKGDNFESNIVLGENSLSKNSNRVLRNNNVDDNLKFPMEAGKDVDYQLQQRIPENTMLSSNNIFDLNKSPNENEEESCKEVIQNKRSPEQDESKKENEQEGSFEQQQQQQEDINGEFDLNIVTSEDSLPNNSDRTLKDKNINDGLKLPIRDEKDQDYYHLKREIPESKKFHSIVDINKCSNRLSSTEEEYNWNCLSISKNQKPEIHNKELALPRRHYLTNKNKKPFMALYIPQCTFYLQSFI